MTQAITSGIQVRVLTSMSAAGLERKVRECLDSNVPFRKNVQAIAMNQSPECLGLWTRYSASVVFSYLLPASEVKTAAATKK